MIGPEFRLFAGFGNLLTGGPYTWHITDLDQRRRFAVTYAPHTPVEHVEETEDICMAQLRKHLDHLGPGVFGIRFSEPDGPITMVLYRSRIYILSGRDRTGVASASLELPAHDHR
jgi:hypothetical protein